MSTDTQHDPIDKSSNLVTAVPEKDKRGSKESEQSLLDRTRDLFLQVLADGEWRSIAELKRKIQDDLARARCSLILPWVYEDLPDKLEHGRLKITAEAVPSLESDGLCETRGSGTHGEIRLKTGSKLVKGEEKRGLSDNTRNARCDNTSTPTEPGAVAGRSEHLEPLIFLVVWYLTNGRFSCPMEDLKRQAGKESIACKRLAAALDTDFLKEILCDGDNVGKG